MLAEIERLERSDLLILQFPLWWFGMPGILKGWVDRVFAMGRVYGMGKWYDGGAFRGKRAMVAMTTGGPETMYSEGGLNPPMDALLLPIEHGVFAFNGYATLPSYIVWGPAHLDDDARQAALDGYAAHLRAQLDAPGTPPPAVADYPPPLFRKAT